MFGQSSTSFPFKGNNVGTLLPTSTATAQTSTNFGMGGTLGGTLQPFGTASNLNSGLQPGQQGLNPQNTGGLYGLGSTAQAQRLPLGQPFATSEVTLTAKTKYADVTPEIRKYIDEFEKFIQSQVLISNMIESRQCGETIQTISKEVKTSMKTISSINNTLSSDMVLARGLLDCVNSELRNNDMINRFIERHRSGNVSGITSQKSDPHVKYFTELVDRLGCSLDTYEARIAELEHTMNPHLLDSKFSSESLAEVMKNQEKTFMTLAHRTEKLQHLAMDRLDEAAQFRMKYFGDNSLMRYKAMRSTKAKVEDPALPSLEQMALEILLPASSQPQL